MDTKQIDAIVKRTQRAWYEDGLWDLGIGLIYLLLGLFYYLVAANRMQPILGIGVTIAQVVLIIASFWIVGWLVRTLKERITYPRTGYITMHRPSGARGFRRGVMNALLAFTLSGILVLVSKVSGLQLFSGAAVLLALAYLYLAYRFGVLRFAIVAVLTVGLGFVSAFLRLGDYPAAAVLFTGEGVIWLASGALTLWHFLRTTQPANPAERYGEPE